MMKKRYWIASLVGVSLLAGGVWWWQRGASDAVQYKSAKIERGNLQAAVAASGTVKPEVQVSVGTQVSGLIRDVFVDFNSVVTKGQLLAQIDPATFEVKVRSAELDVESARSGVAIAQANVMAAQSQVARTQVDVDEAKRDLERKQNLVEKQFIAQSEADKARALVNTTTAAWKATQAQLGVAQAQLKSAMATVSQRESTLAQARIDLARTKITSPVDGIVIKRSIERGQTVASSLQAPELFVIAQNLSNMQVEANIDESDVGRLRVGQKASFTVDAFPGKTFEGDVRQVRKAALNQSNVVTYVAVIAFSNTVGLFPEMTANIRIVTDERKDVLKIPNAALRFKVAGVEPETAKTDKPAGAAPAPATGASAPKTDTPAVPAGESARGGGNQFRDRVVSELKLTEAQTAQVDAIYAEMRPQMRALRDLPEEERGKARERLMGDVRARIASVLTPAQKPGYEALVMEAASRTSSRGRVYLMDAKGKVKALNVRLGITDGSMTELLVGRDGQAATELKEGVEVLTGIKSGSAAPAAASAPRASGGGMGGGRSPF